jgi:hypothetical protein
MIDESDNGGKGSGGGDVVDCAVATVEESLTKNGRKENRQR